MYKSYKEIVEIAPQRIAELIGDFDFPIFPAGTEFAVYDDAKRIIPLVSLPKPDGGRIYLAFDTFVPRAFPVAAFYRHGRLVSQGDFYNYLGSISRP
jgi:hypothetical protein